MRAAAACVDALPCNLPGFGAIAKLHTSAAALPKTHCKQLLLLPPIKSNFI